MKKRAFGKLYKELFYVPKNEKLTDKVFRCRMVLSLLTILACTVVMAASTFALFYSEVSVGNSTIAGAYYSVSIDNTENGTYICPLAFEDKHIFEIKAEGTATTGYCKIQVGDRVYYTEQIPQGKSLTLTIQAANGTTIVFTPYWGTSSDVIGEDVCGNEIIHSTTPYAVYTVESAAELSDIAAHYGVTEEDILIYNDYPNLTVGYELKIPGVPYDYPTYSCIVPSPDPSVPNTTTSPTA